jgi:translation initiation factor IF-3
LRKTYRPRFRKPVGPQYRVNRAIVAPEVRLVDEQGVNVGVVPLEEALRLAEAAELDLVEVSPLAAPPVAKILDFSQFKYKQDKEIQKQKVRQRKQEVKGVRLSLRIGQHDQRMRLDQASRFFDEGHKLKIELPLRGRENQHQDLARSVVESFLDALRVRYQVAVEQPLERQGGRLSVICYSTGKVGGAKPAAPSVSPAAMNP